MTFGLPEAPVNSEYSLFYESLLLKKIYLAGNFLQKCNTIAGFSAASLQYQALNTNNFIKNHFMKTIRLSHLFQQAFFIAFISSAFFVRADAQQLTFEAGLLGGATYYSGELDPQVVGMMPGDLHPAGGAFLRLNTSAFTAVRLSLLQGAVSAADANAQDPELINRNLSFSSKIQEAGLTLEYNLFGMGSKKSAVFSPYAFGGIALFHFNPRALYQGEWVALQPLGTEGQGSEAFPDRKPYSLTNIAFPLGVGVKLALSPRFSFGAEAGLRYTLTDYLDDVSTTYPVFDLEGGQDLSAALSDRILADHHFEAGAQHSRGNPATKDWYYFAGVSFSYHFAKMASGGVAMKGNSVKCYSF